jgi:beta-N-acetylhexosaminidase
MSTREQFLDTVLHRMSLEEKVGQCFTFSWRGHLVTPSIVDVITKLCAGGLRVEPYTTESATALYYGKKLADENFRPGSNFQPIAKTYFQAKHPGAYVTAERYAQTLNRLQRIATSRPGGMPLHITLDFEGDYSHDYPFGGIQMFPAQMGLSATSDPQLAYETGYVIGRQLTAVGVNMLHSPICDVNVNRDNPEVGVRSFSDKADVCAEYAVKLYEGLRDGGIIATAKHYPGRGDSTIDAHEDLDIINVPAETLRARELLPYRALIEAGIGAIMSAHSSYPAIDSTESPSTLSSKLIVDLLRTELGFAGVITVVPH